MTSSLRHVRAAVAGAESSSFQPVDAHTDPPSRSLRNPPGVDFWKFPHFVDGRFWLFACLFLFCVFLYFCFFLFYFRVFVFLVFFLFPIVVAVCFFLGGPAS